MDMVGVYIIRPRCNTGVAFKQTRTGRTALTVRRINARYAQNADPHARRPPPETHLCLGMDAALGPGCHLHRPGLGNPGAAAVAIDATGGTIDHAAAALPAAQCPHQAWVRRIGPALGRRWRQMHHPRGNAGQSAQAWTRDPDCPATASVLWRAMPPRAQAATSAPTGAPVLHLACHAQADIATTDNQHTFTAKSRGQGTKWGLV